MWTPLGPIRSERLVFGLMNAGTVLGRYLSAVFAGLSSAARRRWLNYADDFLAGQTSHKLMFGWLREFLPLCIVNKVALKAPKTRAGYPTAKFVGHLLGHGKVTVLEDNLAPIRGLVDPDGVPALRRVLGLFLMSSDFLPKYQLRIAPLTRLTGKVPWQ